MAHGFFVVKRAVATNRLFWRATKTLDVLISKSTPLSVETPDQGPRPYCAVNLAATASRRATMSKASSAVAISSWICISDLAPKLARFGPLASSAAPDRYPGVQ